ncbi:helix-turn-helix domain-containing protein [Mariniflexile sp.]|uniref:helix-turn-helix domain-containing protein n=1 Tax=Mariniflexile sp. TaxID=1979402 RepID=UPI0035642F5C
MKTIININSITEFHRLLGLQSPEHPLISVIHTKDLPKDLHIQSGKYKLNFYMISLKTQCDGQITYGRNSFDFEEGSMIFTASGQVFDFENAASNQLNTEEGWTLIFHPDFIRHTPLAAQISDYTFFNYEVYEALHISEKEKKMLLEFIKNINIETTNNIDRHSQELITINLESILKYSKRYYDRQFYTRTNLNKDYLVQFERYLKTYFASPELVNKGLPTIKQCGEALNMSGHYLSDLLKAETGESAKEHIHNYMIEQAKNKLLSSTSSVSEIAYDLGFGYPQHFSKLFKLKTGISPSEYRSLN